MMKRTLLLSAALLGLPAVASATPTPAPKPDPSTVSKAVTNKIVDTLAEEIERAMTNLEVPGREKPYLIRYKLTEVEVNDVAASLGSTTSKKDRHFVNLEANVHVGDYKLDNTNFVIPQADGVDGVAAVPLPLEPSPRIARRAAWLATDAAYKEALAQLDAKKQLRASGGSSYTGVPSYTKVDKPLVGDKQVLVPKLETSDQMEKRAKAVSAVLRDKPGVRDSRVAFTSFLERRWYITSEGTSVTDTRRVSGVIMVVWGQATDGQELALYYSRYGETAAFLPSDADLIKAANGLVDQLGQLAKAPVAEGYTGPVLFEGRGAADIVRYSLAPNLGGTPVPEGLEKTQARQYGGAFADRVGRGRVLASMLDVVDDPTKSQYGKYTLIGGYKYDDEGTPAERIHVIDKGKLLTLLMGRTPSRTLAKSNGHARRAGPAGGYHGSATNLFLTSHHGLSHKQLVKKLIATAKSDGLPYGMIIRKLDDGAITAAPERTRRELLSLINETDVEAPPPALLAYRVYPNGREELVRGVELAPVNVRAWRNIVAAGKNETVMNFLATDNPNLYFKLRGIAPGFVPSAGVESAIVTPDLLFREIDLKVSNSGRRPFPLVPAPK